MYFYGHCILMDNKTISRTFKLLSQLMELHDVNQFKTRTIANAAFKLDKLPFTLKGKSFDELSKIDGIGKSLAAKIIELVETGSIAEMEELVADTPPGVMEMMSIKGIGPKKIAVIWRELGIENTGELFYACNENRLIEAKGFGLKTQEEIRKAIEYRMAADGKFLYAQVEPLAEDLYERIKTILPDALVEFGGEYRRRCEVISELIVVIGSRNPEVAIEALKQAEVLANLTQDKHHLNGEITNGILVDLVCVTKAEYYRQLFISTGNDLHVEAVFNRINVADDIPESEELIYHKANLQWIHPEMREGINYLEKAERHQLPELIKLADLKGSLHNHSTWSDGVNTLEEMALYCRDQLQLEYLGICDHSKTAVYAKGLSIERVQQQWAEIDTLNQKIENFHIFKGIESDILSDGSLDYPEEILKGFDFVVTSVHSNLKMDEEKATARLLKAIENPYTTILGHPTGRLLLSRKGYEINYTKVIDACAANNVVIEINANPRRLDLDWRWYNYALSKGVTLSINPDAHRNEGFLDMKYGVLVARKGGVSKNDCLNALSRTEIEQRFKSKKANL